MRIQPLTTALLTLCILLSGCGSKTWPTPKTIAAENLLAIAAIGDNLFVAGDNGAILFSPDAQQWTRASVKSTAKIVSLIPFKGGVAAIGEDASVLWSSGGDKWEASSIPDMRRVWAATGSEQQIDVFGESQDGQSIRASSIDFAHWITSTPRLQTDRAVNVYSIARGNANGTGAHLIASTDFGVKHANDPNLWIQRSWRNRGDAGLVFPNTEISVAFIADRYIALITDDKLKNPMIADSLDGKSWNDPKAIGGEGYYKLGSTGKTAVALGDSGQMQVSKNGWSWEKQRIDTNSRLSAVAAFRGRVYVVGASGLLATSPNDLQ